MFCQPAGVQGRFGPADERLATDSYRAAVSLETVRRAILPGSVRKSMSFPERLCCEPLCSLHYSAGLLEEVRTETFPASYWQHLNFNLRRCERLWRDEHAELPGSARPDSEQPDLSGGARKPSSEAA